MPVTPTSVDVTVTDGVATYKSSNSGVEEDGTININAGEDAVISFEPASEQKWEFVSPWITLDPSNGDISLVSGAPLAVVIQDNNPEVSTQSTYTYCLQTTDGALDPRIINKGG